MSSRHHTLQIIFENEVMHTADLTGIDKRGREEVEAEYEKKYPKPYIIRIKEKDSRPRIKSAHKMMRAEKIILRFAIEKEREACKDKKVEQHLPPETRLPPQPKEELFQEKPQYEYGIVKYSPRQEEILREIGYIK